MEENEKILTFNYQKAINIKEIQLGDIFRNIPYYSPDFLLKSSLNEDNTKIKNEVESIFEDIIRKSNVINTKSIIFPTWAILGSQECDIRSGFDLIFFPLVKYKEINKQDVLITFIEKEIQEWTRYMYIPKSDLEDNKFGPFRVLLQNPFYISYEIVEKHLKYCWVTHIVEKARRVFVGKITNLFTRTPVDELVFIEFDQIENYFQKKWEKAWKEKLKTPYEKSAYEIIDKIIELYYLLKYENEQSKFHKIKILDFNLLEEIIRLTKKSWIFIEENPHILFYKQLIADKNVTWFLKFFTFIDRAIYGDDSIFKTFKYHFDIINQFKEEEEEKFLNYKEINVKEDKQTFLKNILLSKLERPLIEQETFLSYCKPFEKLRFFLKDIGLLE